MYVSVSNSEIEHKIDLIKTFYSSLDYMQLTSFFESQKLYYENDFIGDEQVIDLNNENSIVPYFYNNINHDVTLTGIYRQFKFEVIDSFNKNIKHKKLNDLNQILFDN